MKVLTPEEIEDIRKKNADITRLLDDRDVLVELLKQALVLIERHAEETMYGGFMAEDPRLFTPDKEMSTAEEVALWEADCAAWDRGERPVREGHSVTGTGDKFVSVSKNPYGLGVTRLINQEYYDLAVAIKKILRVEG